MHEIVNEWLAMSMTPTEFVRTKRLGYKTQTSTIKDLNDPVLNEKLTKVTDVVHSISVCCYVVGETRVEMA